MSVRQFSVKKSNTVFRQYESLEPLMILLGMYHAAGIAICPLRSKFPTTGFTCHYVLLPQRYKGDSVQDSVASPKTKVFFTWVKTNQKGLRLQPQRAQYGSIWSLSTVHACGQADLGYFRNSYALQKCQLGYRNATQTHYFFENCECTG